MNNKDFVGVIVDAGHGGEDPGAISGSLKEKDFTLKAAQYMADRLRQLGIDARTTRDTDISLPKSERVSKVKSLFNNRPGVILISNHINAGKGEGAEIVYSLRNNPTLASMALENIKSSGQIGRGVYQRVLPENPSKDYYYILRETGNVEPLLVEYGFIDNSRDANKLQNNLLDYVEGVVKAIADYTGTPYTPPGVISEDGDNTYVVKRGDTLYQIASKYNTSVDNLKKLNNLTSNEIYIGQVLQLVDNSLIGDTYIVKRGDTLYGIANTLGTTVNILKEINNLTSNNLYIGQELLIPSSTVDLEEEEVDYGDEYDTYTVVRGDSLWSISRKFDISVDDLISINNLDGTTLKIGDVLLVPKTDNEFYVVKRGDTIFMGNNEYNCFKNVSKKDVFVI